MRGLGGVVLAGWLVAACSGSTKQDGATGGAGGGGVAAGGVGNGGGASAVAGSAGTAAGSAGAATNEGAPGAHHADCGGDCGGSPVGNWVYTSKTSCNVVPNSGQPPQQTEACTILLLPNSAPGEPNVRLERAPRFDFSGQPLTYAALLIHQDGSFASGVVYSGKGHMTLAAQCRKLGESTVACGDLNAVVEPSLLGEGAGRNFTCVDNAQGGCDCSYDVSLVGGSAGMWSTTPEGKLLFQLSSALPSDPAPVAASYCAGKTLALGPEAHIFGRSISEPAVLDRVDCTDGIKGPGEQDIDCGQVCQPCR